MLSVTVSVTVTVPGDPNVCCTLAPVPAGVPSPKDHSLALIVSPGDGSEVDVKVAAAPATTGSDTVKAAVGAPEAGAAASIRATATDPVIRKALKNPWTTSV